MPELLIFIGEIIMKKFFIIIILLIFYNKLCFSDYKGIVGYFDKSEEMQEFILDEEGNITFGINYDISHEPHKISISPNSKLILVTSGPWGDGRLDLFSIDSNLNLTYKGIALNNVAYYSPVTFTPDSKYVIIICYRTDIEDWTISLFRIEEDLLIDLSSYIPIPENNLLSLIQLAMSSFGGTFCGVDRQDDIYEMCVFKFDEETETISFTGQRIPLTEIGGTRDTRTSSNGRTCAHSEVGTATAILTINPDGSVNEDVHYVAYQDGGINNLVFSPNSQYLYITYMGGSGTLESHHIDWDGTPTLIQYDKGDFEGAQAFDITPDGKFGVIAHHYVPNYQTVSVIKFNGDGTFQKLDKDFTMLGHFSDLKFIPPYVTSAEDEIWEMYE